jgi:hypothetical protein
MPSSCFHKLLSLSQNQCCIASIPHVSLCDGWSKRQSPIFPEMTSPRSSSTATVVQPNSSLALGFVLSPHQKTDWNRLKQIESCGITCYILLSSYFEWKSEEEIADHSNLESSDVKECCLLFTIVGQGVPAVGPGGATDFEPYPRPTWNG